MILMDVEMPVMDGLKLLQKENLRRILFLFL